MSDKPEILWAPWRLEYIESAVANQEGCFLCNAVNTPDDKDHLVLHRTEHTVVVMNLYPYNNGHLLVAPSRHIGRLDEQVKDEITALGEIVKDAVKWLQEAYQPDGFNVGLNLGRVAGAGLPGHLHYHIVPRWDGDTNFMPVLGLTKVVSEGLGASYDKIKRVIDRQRQ